MLYFDQNMLHPLDLAADVYKESEFMSPTRSTVPMLSLLRHDYDLFSTILRRLGMSDQSDIHLEYTVKSPQGKGTPSHTDVFVRDGNNTLAIEAKWTEPRYITVEEWLKPEESSPTTEMTNNREQVMQGWLQLFEPFAGRKPLHREDFFPAVYQMVHRAASACASSSSPRLAYFVFKPSLDTRSADVEIIRQDLNLLHQLLGSPATFPFYLIEIGLNPTAAFASLQNLKKGQIDTATQVKAKLFGQSQTRLFDFHLDNCWRI